MTDSSRTYFDSFIHLAGDPARRARDLAGKVREDLRSGKETLKSGADQAREHGTRTAVDIGRLLRAEFDASLSRIGVATQADLDDLNLRLEHSEEQIRDLRIRLAEAEARVAATAKRPEPPAAPAGFVKSDEEPAGDA
jgi:chromosome segregation ATPase